MYLKKNEAALTPPMGWNSWDCYAAGINEQQLLANAKLVAEKLKPHGWQYVVCDIQWSEPYAGTEPGVEYRKFAPLTMDKWGRLVPAPNRFPSSKDGVGFRAIADQIHDMGLKFGIHIMRGIPRQAVHAHTPIFGTDRTADQAALPASVCNWNGDMYGLDPKEKGAQEYYDSIFQLYAEWGVDFVKVDDICSEHMYDPAIYGEGEVSMIRKAIDRCGRQMVLSLSPGPALIEKAWHLEMNANMWRLTDDFWDNWTQLCRMFERCEVWESHVKPGCWPDCDMLPLGRIGTGFGKGRDSGFSKEEQRTLMTLWGIFRSPLMMGGDLEKLDAWTESLLTNDKVLGVNQNGSEPWQLERDEKHAVWMSKAPGEELFLALFNLSDEAASVAYDVSQLKETYGRTFAEAEDLWGDRKASFDPEKQMISVSLKAHDAGLYRLF